MLGNRKSQHSFAQIPTVNIGRSSFNRSFAMKDTFDFDYLVPIFVDEMLPGDTANVTLSHFARLATQKVPIMDNMYIDFYFFFVPNRLVWINWEKFNGAQDNPGDSTSYLLPQCEFPAGGPEVGTIFDKMGLPTDVPGMWVLRNTLPLRAYKQIYNDWFRDQNLQNTQVIDKTNGPDVPADFTLLKGAKAHDYFTSALPWPQKGPAVQLPLSSNIFPVESNNLIPTVIPNTALGADHKLVGTISGGFNNIIAEAPVFGSQDYIRWGTETGLEANLSGATVGTINQLREAFSMQALFELDARGGTRYVEILRAHFNVVSPDFRLQRAEYLGGGRSNINSHPVPQTAPTSGSNPQAQLAAFATSSSSGSIGFTKSFVEHGYVIGLARARADVTYQQGINRMWNRSSRYDFYWPKLSELGEQTILNKEIYTVGLGGTDDEAFGYQERYAEYRYMPSQIKGQFRSTYATSLDVWHLAEEFGSLPALNGTFIQSNTPIERAIATPSEPDLLFDAFFNYKHARPMPVYSVPATIGRF